MAASPPEILDELPSLMLTTIRQTKSWYDAPALDQPPIAFPTKYSEYNQRRSGPLARFHGSPLSDTAATASDDEDLESEVYDYTVNDEEC